MAPVSWAAHYLDQEVGPYPKGLCYGLSHVKHSKEQEQEEYPVGVLHTRSSYDALANTG